MPATDRRPGSAPSAAWLISGAFRVLSAGETALTDPCQMTAEALVAAFAGRRLSPVEATKAVLARIERHAPTFNTFTLVDADRALDQARAAELRYGAGTPLSAIDGVPTTIKGLSGVLGWPNQRGSRLIDPVPTTDEASWVARLREAGVVMLGLTTSPEFGWKGLTDSPLTGITRNPWNPERTPGGSSGGAAVAAACGFGPLHQGSDGAGSIRIPAAFTGVFGIKATFGRVPSYPSSAFRTVSHTGPITRTVRDGALMLNILQRPDHRDPTALPFGGTDWLDGIEAGARDVRIGYSPTLGGRAKLHPDVRARVDAAVKTLAAIGAKVEEVDPDLPDHADSMLVMWSAAAAKLESMLPQDRLHLADPGFRAMAAIGRRQSTNDWLAADAVRIAMGRAMGAFLQRFDVLVTPTMPIPAFKAGQDLSEPGQATWMDWSPFSYPFNMTRQPAASVPCGFASDGLPVGLHIVGRMYDEAMVLRVARAYEHAMPPVFPKLG
ncbi:MAG: amidase [Alphaproteobacteria bacterium]|nr:amidase [Alphaproteobacteria bacterium]